MIRTDTYGVYYSKTNERFSYSIVNLMFEQSLVHLLSDFMGIDVTYTDIQMYSKDNYRFEIFGKIFEYMRSNN
ncbi:hypothetical protein LCGC14_0174430 [marine sediment metagenome]|uniref:Uncharacterized protein n=1 Tax=marine sediment metagenome TaxID=412755 RepID=A0A0F9UV00_9ZZZZ